MRDELLATRLDVLLRSAVEVEAVVNVLVTSRTALTKTMATIRMARNMASQLTGYDDLEPLTDALEQTSEKLAREQDSADDAQTVRQVLDLLDRLDRATIPALREELKHASDGLATLVNRHVPFNDALSDQVRKTTLGVRTQIKSVRDALMSDDEPLEELWRTYLEKVLPQSELLFAEYLDLLGGVLIREGGLEIGALASVCKLDDLCALADWHLANELRLRLPVAVPQLALPSGELISGAQSWPIVRLGFAHWSIWGLPFEAHEFGRLAAVEQLGKQDVWQEELEAFGEDGLRLLISDTIGAWAEGPAYACALCFLSLDPRRCVGNPPGPHVTASDRAFLVDTCLRQQVLLGDTLTLEDADVGHGYVGFLDTIGQRWQEALKCAGARATARGELLQRLPQRIWKQLGLEQPFGIADWDASKDACDDLLGERDLASDPPVGIRHLMNAAWYARVDAGSPAVDADEIEWLALSAGKQIANVREGRGRAARRGAR